MKKRLNSTFFGICFLAALLGETYCFVVLEGEIISTIGIGVVMLITGYLFLDSIISNLKRNLEQARLYSDRFIQEETKRFDEKYTELINFQKAIYTATKKNTMLMAEQMKELSDRIEISGNGSVKELQRVIDLQKKSMEGQRNALNMEIHYGKENTKQLINVVKELGDKPDHVLELSNIINLLEENKQLLSSGIVTLDVYKQSQNFIQGKEEPAVEAIQEGMEEETAGEMIQGDIVEEPTEGSVQGGIVEEPNEETGQEDIVGIVADEVIQEDVPVEEMHKRVQDEVINEINDSDFAAVLITDLGFREDNYPVTQDVSNEDFQQSEQQDQTLSEQSFLSQDILDQVMMDDSSAQLTEKEELDLDAVTSEESTKTVTPLYTDPNKALSADEIAALFASFGQ